MAGCLTNSRKASGTAATSTSGALFRAAFSDAEHAAEDQGNSLPYLTGVLYGNARYLDWNIRTLEDFRNYLTGVNDAGRRHFRSADFDSTRYAQDLERGARDVEAAICYRAFGPVSWLIWYNGNPVARRLLLEHAETWLAAAMSTQKGKPRGVIPVQLGFDDTVGEPIELMGSPWLGAGPVARLPVVSAQPAAQRVFDDRRPQVPGAF